MDSNKLEFVSAGAFKRLETLEEQTKPHWGVMNAQEMTEHLADFFDVSAEKIPVKLLIPEEHLPRYMEFLMSEKPFRENTKAPAELLGEKPLPLRFASLEEAKNNLQRSVAGFMNYFKDDENKRTLHPVFGMLNYDEWVRLHFKHVQHHLKQFGLVDPV